MEYRANDHRRGSTKPVTMSELPDLPDTLTTERFSTATDTGEVTDRSGYHKRKDLPAPRDRSPGWIDCRCDATTPKGAYRDVTVAMPDGRTIHYYHQSPVVVEKDGAVNTYYRLDSCGYKTDTTKGRINEHIPHGWKVRQIDFEWYVETPDDDRIEFDDGMVIHSGRNE